MQTPRVWAVIPARIQSSRFPRKILAPIHKRPMISWVIAGLKESSLPFQILVATDDKEIAQVAQDEGVEVAMTSSDCPSGSDRIYEALQSRIHEGKEAPLEGDIVVNVQGDEPLMSAEVFDLVVEPLLQNEAEVTTLVTHFESVEEIENPNRVKALVNRKGFCSYFSRFPIPFSRVKAKTFKEKEGVSLDEIPVKKHIGIYAYTWKALQVFVKSPPSLWERSEGLEQLRFLEAGQRMKAMVTDYKGLGVDHPEDIAEVETLLESKLNKDRA